MQIDRRAFIASLGGPAAVALMTDEQRADALEHYMEERLNAQVEARQAGKYPTVAEIQAANEKLPYRRGAGDLFTGRAAPWHRSGPRQPDGRLHAIEKMPDKPTLLDFFHHRFSWVNHVLQSATRALKTGMKEEVVLACLLHDVVLNIVHPDHGWWGAQLFEPYVPPTTTFAIRYHQALRFYPDPDFGYEYPEGYFRTFGVDYKPEPYLEETYKRVRKHKWYEYPRLVTVNDLYAFDPEAVVSIDPFVDIIGRHFKQPKEGLGFDNSPSAHMFRTMIWPDRPL